MKIFINILLFVSLITCSFTTTLSAFPRYKSIFNFGDSLSDTGNILRAGVLAFPAIAELPYGQTFFKRPTGRCSDGRLIVDFIAEASGLKHLQPYLWLEKRAHSGQGVNFAVAGATALSPDFFYEQNIGHLLWTTHSLNIQVNWFKKLKHTLCKTKPECDNYFKTSLFIVGEIGGNDYNYQLFSGKTVKQLGASVPLVVGSIANTISFLIGEGAKEVLVPGNLPIGCSAMYLTVFKSPNKADYDENGCLKVFNDFSMFHNKQLQGAIQTLRGKFPNNRIIYADYYGASMQFFHRPANYGFKDGALKACCGGGGPYNYNTTIRCGQIGAKVCANPSAYANFDGIHLTEAAYQAIANGLTNGPFCNPPFI